MILKFKKGKDRLQRLFSRLLFFFLIGKENNSNRKQTDNTESDKNNHKIVHFYSPLLKKVPTSKHRANNNIPITASPGENFSGAAIFPMIKTAAAICDRFNQVLASPSFCLLFNTTNNILSNAKILVKFQAKRNVRLIKPTGMEF